MKDRWRRFSLLLPGGEPYVTVRCAGIPYLGVWTVEATHPFICLEPGRSIVGESGITLYTVGSVKVIPKIRTYVSIDGGMTDNPRYALYKSSYLAVIADKAGQPAVEKVTIAGKCCESGDLIQEDAMIQEAAPGDTLAVFSTGLITIPCRPIITGFPSLLS